MQDCPFIVRSKQEYESELGPKLLLIAEKPLDTDNLEIFDSIQALSYLTEVFKSKFKSAETHITYIQDETDEPFARNVFFNILGHYVKKGTLTVVTEDNKEITLHEGEVLPELIGKYHYGKNTGKEPVELIVFYLGQKGTPLSVNK